MNWSQCLDFGYYKLGTICKVMGIATNLREYPWEKNLLNIRKICHDKEELSNGWERNTDVKPKKRWFPKISIYKDRKSVV